ncbi:MAG: biopolymer transporter ExbD [Methylococcales bacterium]|nr:biopolymer transporter ExbD [Methylococcales bacterium]
MAIQFHNNSENREISDINVTPFVDVSLVLLIIFMVAAPLLTQVVRVSLPKTAKTEQPAAQHLAILSVNARGEPQLDDQAVAIDALESVLKALQERDPAINVQLQVDRNTIFDAVAKVMACAQRAGITRLSFVTLEK